MGEKEEEADLKTNPRPCHVECGSEALPSPYQRETRFFSHEFRLRPVRYIHSKINRRKIEIQGTESNEDESLP